MSIEKAFDEDSAKIASELSVNVISSFETETVDAFFSMAISPSSPHFPKKPSAGETFFKFDAEFLKTTFADISPPSLEDLPDAYIEDENCGRTAMPFKRGDIWESFTSNLASKSASKLALFIIAEAFSISASLRLASNFTEMPPTDGAHVALIKNSSGARFFGSAFIFAETVPSDGIKSEAIFSEEMFESVEKTSKEEALQLVCKNAENRYDMEGLYSQIIKREKIGSSFFSRQIAVPHPLCVISSDTFVSVLVSKEPIIWDEERNEVNLVMLLHIGKNNPRAFQMWEYFSKIFADKTLVEKLSEKPSYDVFIELIKEALEAGMNDSEF